MRSVVRKILYSGTAVATVLAGVLLVPSAPAAAPPATVTIAGSLDDEIGCSSEWQPGCAAAHLAKDANGLWTNTFTVPAGSYEYKAALNDSWVESYGGHGGSGNISLQLATDSPVTFYYDESTHYLTDSVNSTLTLATGDFQSELGCKDNDPTCLKTLLEDLKGDGIARVTATAIPAGSYTAQAAKYGGAKIGTAVSFTVPGGGGIVVMSAAVNNPTQLTVTVTPFVQAPPATFSHPTAGRGDVVANLFEWNWASVAKECTTVLGPAGYGYVQVAPPQDSLKDPTSTSGHPWWTVYQPVSYQLTSRMGNEDEFKTMVATCRTAGVKVVVDAVINHMTGQGSKSYGGVTFTKYDYPGLYTKADFHNYPQDCPRADDTISDFNDYTQVTKCELVGLSDLRTESDKVRDTLAGYLNKLLSYGVSGFRVDAAKHIGQVDLGAIESRLHNTVDGGRPYIALEVPPGGPGKLTPFAFQDQGSLLGFDFATQVRDAFRSNVTDLSVFGAAAGLLPSDHSLAFVANHDTERNGQTLSYKDGPTYTLATQFMLAYGYGRPEVYASFTFANSDDAPPGDTQGIISDTDCTKDWACTNRSIGVANLVDVHNFAGDAPVANWYDNGTDTIAFSRGNRAFFALNNGTTARTITVTTGLASGTYCDVTHGTYTPKIQPRLRVYGSCTGPTVRVAAGKATITLAPQSTVAFDSADLVSH